MYLGWKVTAHALAESFASIALQHRHDDNTPGEKVPQKQLNSNTVGEGGVQSGARGNIGEYGDNNTNDDAYTSGDEQASTTDSHAMIALYWKQSDDNGGFFDDSAFADGGNHNANEGKGGGGGVFVLDLVIAAEDAPDGVSEEEHDEQDTE